MIVLFIAWIRQHVIPYALVFLALCAAVFGVRRAGREAERADQMKETIEKVKVRNEVENNVVSMSDADRQRLRDKWTR
jgi:hypothetical protein